MSGFTNILLANTGSGPDPFFSQVAYLFGYETAAPNILDEGPNGYVATPSAGPNIDPLGARFGDNGYYVTGGNLGTAYILNTLTPIPVDTEFTWEAFVNWDGTTPDLNLCFMGTGTVGNDPDHFFLGIQSATGAPLLSYYDTSFKGVLSSINLVQDTWYHVAGTREQSGSDWLYKIWVNGSLGGTFNAGTTASALGAGELHKMGSGAQGTTNTNWRGGMDESRLTIGVARYTSNFTVPNSAFPRE